MTHRALAWWAGDWVRSAKKAPGLMELETRVEIPVPSAGGRRGEIDVEGDPSRYAYSLPIFLALLLPAQAFSFYLLAQIVLAAQGDERVLRVDRWQLEAIAYAYQLGVLVVPTLAPVLLWARLDRAFVQSLLPTKPAPAAQSQPGPAPRPRR